MVISVFSIKDIAVDATGRHLSKSHLDRTLNKGCYTRTRNHRTPKLPHRDL